MAVQGSEMLSLTIFVLAVILASASLEANWLVYKKTHNKVYTEDEDNAHRLIWQTNLQKIEQHNELYAKGQYSYYMGQNQFTDMTKEELKAMNGLKLELPLNPGNIQTRRYRLNLPDSFDWRDQGAVSPVKNQGLYCGSCWSFSTTGVVEGAHFKATGKLISLSEKNLMDCSQDYGNKGCNGGLVADALQYIIDNKGIDTEDSYPYSTEMGPCQYNPSNSGATISSVTHVEAFSEDALKQAVVENCPISVAIDGDHMSVSYQGGVYDNPACNASDLNHAVLVVGYGSEDGKDFWIVKNSWGDTWGESGYIRMSRNKDNQCGIASRGMYPLV